MLRQKTGYVSLKIRESEAQAAKFPPLFGNHVRTGWENIEESQERNDDEEPIVFLNPIEQKDNLIQEKIKEAEKLKKVIDEKEVNASTLQHTNNELCNENSSLKQQVEDMSKKLRRTQILMEKKLEEKLGDPNWDPDNNSGFEITALANLVNEEELGRSTEDSKPETKSLRPSRKTTFLANVQKNCDPKDGPKNARLEKVKNKILERRLSMEMSSPSRGRSSSMKRPAEEPMTGDNAASKPRTSTSIPRPTSISNGTNTSATPPQL